MREEVTSTGGLFDYTFCLDQTTRTANRGGYSFCRRVSPYYSVSFWPGTGRTLIELTFGSTTYPGVPTYLLFISARFVSHFPKLVRQGVC